MKSRVVIYDFDNTLFNSHTRETGEQFYLEKTGKKWAHSGWYGRVETLHPPFVTDPVTEEHFVPHVLAAFRVDRADKNTNVFMMTGRPAKMRHRIVELLDAVDAKFDDYFFRGMKGQHIPGDTLEIKLHLIEHKILPMRTVFEIWEDRPEHASRFMTEARRWRKKFNALEKVIVHDVPSQQSHEF